MREEARKRQKAYWEIAAAMTTIGYQGLGPGDIEDVHRMVLEGRPPTSDAGKQIAAALGNYFNEGGGLLTPGSTEEASLDRAEGSDTGDEALKEPK